MKSTEKETEQRHKVYAIAQDTCDYCQCNGNALTLDSLRQIGAEHPATSCDTTI